MLQNLKTDIIYYKTNTDFEMEFNLCGCCRMRLLTDKAPDKKLMVHGLARAVSRSRVIIITGSLFGEDGIIELTARAIAKTLTEIDNAKYGIKTEEKISVINGATPLVAPDGEFAGCIIESGPQSMILITDDKSVRKTVMKSLIHPYIEELYTLDLKAKTASAPEKPTEAEAPVTVEAETPVPVTEEAESAEPSEEDNAVPQEDGSQEESEPKEETDETAEEEENAGETAAEDGAEQNESPAEQPISSFTSKPNGAKVSGGMSFTEDGETDKMPEVFIDPQSPRKLRREYYNQPYAPETNESFVFRSDEDYTKRKGLASSANLPILILSILLLVVLAVLCYCIFYVPAKSGVSPAVYLQETFSTLFG